MSDTGPALNRRRFLGTASTSAALAGSIGVAHAGDDRPAPVNSDSRSVVTNPRATSGDTRHGPKWDESFTLTVGNDKGDLCGRDRLTGAFENTPRPCAGVFAFPTFPTVNFMAESRTPGQGFVIVEWPQRLSGRRAHEHGLA